MPAMAFADDGTEPVTVLTPADSVQAAPVRGESPGGETADELVTDEEYNPIKPGELRLYDDDGNLVENPEAFMDEHGISYPTKLEFSVETGAEGLIADYKQYNVRYESFYQWNNRFMVTFSNSDTKIYTCTVKGDDYWYDFYETDETGKIIGDYGFFTSTSADGNYFTETNNLAIFTVMDYFQIGEKYYVYQKASDEYQVQVLPADYYIFVKDSKGEEYGVYDGKYKTLNKANFDIYTTNYMLPEIISVTPSKVKTIGTHAIKIKINNDEGLYSSDTYTSYYNIYPKAVTEAKVTNPKKNTIKVSWKYLNKANYNQIYGYKVYVYDSNWNIVVEKTYKKKATYSKNKNRTVTINSSKLKKGKKYNVEIVAYKTVNKIQYRSDAVIKTKKLTK
jgi:hypothetical protein